MTMAPPEISPEGMVITHGAKSMSPAEKEVAMNKLKELVALQPASVDTMTNSDQRQSPDKLLTAMATRFLAGETIPTDLRARFQQAAGQKIPFTDAAVRKMILAMVQSPLYQVT
jgi:hypothetical protein